MLYRGSDSERGFQVLAVFVNGKYIERGKLLEENASRFFRGEEVPAIKRKFIDFYNSAA